MDYVELNEEKKELKERIRKALRDRHKKGVSARRLGLRILHVDVDRIVECLREMWAQGEIVNRNPPNDWYESKWRMREKSP